MFQAKVGGTISAVCVFDSDADTLANNIREALLSTAEEVLGKQRKKIQSLVTNEIVDLCDHETAVETTEVNKR